MCRCKPYTPGCWNRALPEMQREVTADALKALALLGVFLVNGMGYLSAPAYPLPLGLASPADSWLSIGVHAGVFTVFMGKAWPLLTFMFGHSLGLMARGFRANALQARAALKSRYLKLLLIGAVHGLLIYYGDVLTAYALAGLVVCRWAHLRLRVLLKKLRFWGGFSVLIWLGMLLLAWSFDDPSRTAAVAAAEPSYGNAPAQSQWVLLNASTYLEMLLTMFLYLPQVILLMLAGLICARLRLLQPSRRLARSVWAGSAWQVLFLFGAVIQLCVTVGMATRMRAGAVDALWFWQVANSGVGLCWLSGAVGLALHALRRGAPAWLVALSPAGRYTLVLYLGLSLCLAALAPAWAGSALLAWHAHPLQHSAIALVSLFSLWAVAVTACAWTSRRGLRDPLARWLSRSTMPTASKRDS